MRGYFRPLAVLTVCGVLSGCAAGILRMDQDQYDDGTALEFLAGSIIRGVPDGDRFGLVIPPASITDDTPFDLGRAVRIGDRVEFLTEDHTVPDRYRIVWTASRLPQGSTSAVTNIILRDDAGREALRIRYDQNRLEPIYGDDVGIAPLTLNAELPHEVRVTLNMTGATASADVRVSQSGEVLQERNNLVLLDGDFAQLDAVEVRSQIAYYMKDLIAITLEN